jgi:porphobilinogen synthase
MSPIIRPRRLRKSSWIRELVAEHNLQTSDLIYPVFITAGANIAQPVATMPGVFTRSLDLMLKEIEIACNLGIKAINIFPKVETDLKDISASHAFNQDNLICRAIRSIKAEFGNQIGVICDVALDPYTLDGHDGLTGVDGDVDNDKTLIALSKQAIVLAKSGVDFISPSDMMDGRVASIRADLDKAGFSHVGIVSYAVKYASKLYGPFRQAIGSSAKGIIDKAGYQIDVRNHKQAMRQINLDIEQSADIILIKPAIYSLDIIFNASQSCNVPVFAYQVSGEYSMLQHYASSMNTPFTDVALEALLCIKRAGAKGIFSYAAIEVAKILNN